MVVDRRKFFTLLVVLALSTTLIVMLSFNINFTSRTRFVRSQSNVVFDGRFPPWAAAVDHSNCPLDKQFKVYLYNFHNPQLFQQHSPSQQSLLEAFESSLKQKQMWAANPKETCIFIVLLRPFLWTDSPSRPRDKDVAHLLLSLPYWTYHGSEGTNHVIVDLLDSTQQESPLFDLINVGDATTVSNYATETRGILAPPMLLEVLPAQQSQVPEQAAVLSAYAKVERIYSGVNSSHEYSSILPLNRKRLFYFEGSYVQSENHDTGEADAQLAKLQEQAFSMSDSNHIKLSSECRASNLVSWNGEWRLCDSSERNRLLQCKDSNFSLILGPLSPEDKPGPITYLRLIESLKCGSIPVVIGLGKLPFDDVINWRRAALIFPWVLWQDAMQVAAAMNPDMIMNFRKQGKFLLHTYFSDPGLVLDSIVAVVRRSFLHPPPLAQDFNPTIIKRNGGGSKKRSIRDSSRYLNYALNMGDRIWNTPPGPHFVYPVSPFQPLSYHNQMEARSMPLPDSIKALGKTMDERQIHQFTEMDRLSALKRFGGSPSKTKSGMRTQLTSDSKSSKKPQSLMGGVRYRYAQIPEKYTVVTLTHHRDEQIAEQIRSLENCPFLHKVVIVWNNEYPIPQQLDLPNTRIPIEVNYIPNFVGV